MDDPSEQITLLLRSLERGEPMAADKLLPIIYEELRARSGRLLAKERNDHTLQRTALVHEAYLRLVRPGASFESRLHFMNAAALAMRRILINHAKARGAGKRGGGKAELCLDEIDAPAESPGVDVLALDEAMNKLEAKSSRQHQVVMLRFFAGQKDEEIAELLQVSAKTVRRDWVSARLWLHGEINR
jgi:RNA polymerase sigma-70 factor, ECF subfamily